MKCQILFSKKNKKMIISFSSAEFVHSMVSVKYHLIIWIYLTFTSLWARIVDYKPMFSLFFSRNSL